MASSEFVMEAVRGRIKGVKRGKVTFLQDSGQIRRDIHCYSVCAIYSIISTRVHGTMTEWLRCCPAKAVRYACESSNLSGVVFFPNYMVKRKGSPEK